MTVGGITTKAWAGNERNIMIIAQLGGNIAARQCAMGSGRI